MVETLGNEERKVPVTNEGEKSYCSQPWKIVERMKEMGRGEVYGSLEVVSRHVWRKLAIQGLVA